MDFWPGQPWFEAAVSDERSNTAFVIRDTAEPIVAPANGRGMDLQIEDLELESFVLG